MLLHFVNVKNSVIQYVLSHILVILLLTCNVWFQLTYIFIAGVPSGMAAGGGPANGERDIVSG